MKNLSLIHFHSNSKVAFTDSDETFTQIHHLITDEKKSVLIEYIPAIPTCRDQK